MNRLLGLIRLKADAFSKYGIGSQKADMLPYRRSELSYELAVRV